MDKPNERKLFVAIHPQIKEPYRNFIEALQEQALLYQFFANCFPVVEPDDTDPTKQIICLQYNNSKEMDRIRATINSNQTLKDHIVSTARHYGVLWQKIKPLADGELLLSPKYQHKKLLDAMNGMSTCINYWIKHLKPKGLTRIRVYDNMCVHSDNLITEFIITENQPQRNG